MKSLKKILSLLLALCLVFTLAACIPNQTDPTDPSTEATSPTEEASVPTESNPTAPTETISPTTGATNTDPTTAPTVPPEESTDPTDDTTAPIESGETEPTEPPIQFPLSYSDSSATITITREWFEDAWCYIAHLQFADYTRFGTDCANGAYDNGFETTSHAAQRLGAIFAVNGCCSAPFLDYPVIRSGVLCNGSGRSLWVPAVYSSSIGVRPLNHAGEVPDKGSWQFTNAIDSWNWDGFEGTKAVVEVYADAASVSLYLNGKKIGNKPLKNNIARFTVAYAPGTLYAEALDESGRVIGKAELTSGEKGTILSAKPEKTVIHADGQELCYIPIEFTDPAGKLKPYVEEPVEVSVSGPATLAGFGSALCKTNERFDAGAYTSYRGRVLAVLRAGMTPGTVTVQVKSAGQAPVTLEIEVQ